MGIKDPGARQQLRPRIEKKLYEIFSGRIAKQVVGTPADCEESGIGPCREVGPLRNGKRIRVWGKSRVMWDHRPLHEL
jgi:hypothetical protein